MQWLIAGGLVVVGFLFLLLTFSATSKVAGHMRPYIGIGLLVAPIITAMLDFTVWAIAESVVTIIFFCAYPSDQISGHGIIAPVAVLLGCMGSFMFSLTIPLSLIYMDIGHFGDEHPNVLPLVGAALTFGMCLISSRHLWPKTKLALRVLGRSI